MTVRKIKFVDDLPCIDEAGKICVCDPESPCCPSGIAPPSLLLTVSGIANGTCGDCADFNGTYELPFSGSTDGTCFYDLELEQTICSPIPGDPAPSYSLFASLRIFRIPISNEMRIGGSFYVVATPPYGLFNYDFASGDYEPDFACDAISSMSLGITDADATGTECDYTGVAFEVSSP